MNDKLAIQKECPVTRAPVTYTFERKEVALSLQKKSPIEVFCTGCAQLHALTDAERQSLARMLDVKS